MNAEITALLEAALAAPSRANSQPWRFVVDESDSAISVFVDPNQDASILNPGQRLARLAVGAAVENMTRLAERNRWAIDLVWGAAPALVRLRLRSTDRAEIVRDPLVDGRVTNRRPYANKPMPVATADGLVKKTAGPGPIKTHWIFDRPRLNRLAELIGEAETILYCEPVLRQAALADIRRDRPPSAEVEHGLSLGSLECSRLHGLGLGLVRFLPQRLFEWRRLQASIALRARTLVWSSSGLCLISAPDYGPMTDVQVGRAAQRAWLAANELGLAGQPLMSIPILTAISEIAPVDLRQSLERWELASIARGLRRYVGNGRCAWILRVGFAKPPTSVVGRRPLNDCIEIRDQRVPSPAIPVAG